MFRGMVSFLAVAVVTFMMAVSGVNSVFAQEGRELKTLIETLEVGDPTYYENLTIIPIYTDRIKDSAGYATLDEALKYHWLEISELEGGRVPQVRLTNNSNRYIYIMGGEILTGCKQDRIIGRDVLIRPRNRNIVVPVYCVEQGRWDYSSDQFYTKENLGTANLRGYAQKAGSDAQQTIWREVDNVSRKAKVESRTRAYQEVYDAAPIRRTISSYEKRLQSIPHMQRDTVGVIVAVGGNIISVDIFSSPYLFKTYWPKILKSSVLTAITAERSGSVTQNDAIWCLRRLHDKHYTQNPAIDLGLEFSAIDRGSNVNALVYRGVVIHLAAFLEDNGSSFGGYDDHERRIPVMRNR